MYELIKRKLTEIGMRPKGGRVVVVGVVLVLVEVDSLVVGRASPFTSDDSPLFSTAFNVVAVVALFLLLFVVVAI